MGDTKRILGLSRTVVCNQWTGMNYWSLLVAQNSAVSSHFKHLDNFDKVKILISSEHMGVCCGQ